MAPAHFTQGSEPGSKENKLLMFIFMRYYPPTPSPNVKVSTKVSGLLTSQYNTGEKRNLRLSDDAHHQI